MVGCSGGEVAVTSWGWQGDHRLWLCRWTQQRGRYVILSGPAEACEAMLKLDRTKHRLKWVTGDPFADAVKALP